MDEWMDIIDNRVESTILSMIDMDSLNEGIDRETDDKHKLMDNYLEIIDNYWHTNVLSQQVGVMPFRLIPFCLTKCIIVPFHLLMSNSVKGLR